MARFKKVIAVIAVMATVATCFAGCGTAKDETSSKAKTESSVSQAEEKEEKNEESEVKEEEKAPVADIPSDYELPASPEVVVYQNDKEVFHYAGETTSELRSILKGMGLKDNGGYKVIEDYKLSVRVDDNCISIDANSLNDDMRIVVDGKEMETMQSIAVDEAVKTDTSSWKPADFKTKQHAYLRLITNSNSGVITGCQVQINNVPEN